jgi:hypothetical protein
VLTLDGADEEDNRTLLQTIRRVRRMKINTEGENTVLVLDDLEGFTEQTRKQLASYFKKTADDKDLGGVLLTLNQLRDPGVRELSNLENVKLFAPFERTLMTWFANHHPWTASLPDGRTEARRGHGTIRVSRARDTIATRDIRRVDVQLKWLQAHDAAISEDRAPVFDNIFGATRRLFSEDGDWKWWANHAQDRDLLLLKEHYPTYQEKPDGETGADTMDMTAHTLDALSLADAMEPYSFELHGAQRQYRMAIGALAVCSTTRARDVGALAPPARLEGGLGPRAGTNARGETLGVMEFLDRHSSQGGPAPLHDRSKHTYDSAPGRSKPS